jgi:3-phenylpropionate/cinnamic acid dioxygenase small subunit
MKLPNAENAVVDIAKLRDYCLNPSHPEGKHKARVFQEKLGIVREDAEQLRQAILEAILTAETTEQKPTEYGRRFIVDFQVSRPEGQIIMSTAWVRTAWIIRNDEDFPRLTTCFNPGRSL